MFLALSKIWPESVKQMSVELMYCATRSTAISLLHTPRSSKSAYYKDNCIPMFTVVLFTIVKLWNQPRWIKENMEFTQLLRRIKSCHLENG
jgi:hypothetical protein